MRILVTGAAGFIGAQVSTALLDRGDEVVGFDNVNDYYDPSLKKARLARLEGRDGFELLRHDLAGRGRSTPRSIDRPTGSFTWPPRPVCATRWRTPTPTWNRTSPARSTSSRAAGIGAPTTWSTPPPARCTEPTPRCRSRARQRGPPRQPLCRHQEGQRADGPHLQPALRHPHHRAALLHRVRALGQARQGAVPLHQSILEGRPIDVFNEGRMRRDFTDIDDIVEGVVRVLDRVPSPNPSWSGDSPDPATSTAPYRLYNIGNHSPVELMAFIGAIEDALGRRAELNLLPMQPGDVAATYAEVDDLIADVGFSPATPTHIGIGRFVDWYSQYYGV